MCSRYGAFIHYYYDLSSLLSLSCSSPAGISYTQSPSLLKPESQTGPSPPPLPPRPAPSSRLPAQDTLPPDPQPPSSTSQRAHPYPSPPHTDTTDTSQGSNIAPLPPTQPHYPPIGSLSFDRVAANCSISLKPKSPVRTSSIPGAPTTLHTISDSPRHHVTHLPPGPAFPTGTSAMVVGPMLMPRTQLESTYYQGTFAPSQPKGTVAAVVPGSPTVAQATEDIPAGGGGGMPRPHPVASSGILPLEQCPILMSEVPGSFPDRSKLPSHKVLFSRNPVSMCTHT